MEISVKASSQSILGILPVARGTIERSIKPVWADEWALVGHGESYDTCGVWLTKGCLNVEAHSYSRVTIDGGKSPIGLAVFKRYQMSCDRLSCPVCFKFGAKRGAKKIAHRLEAWKSKGNRKVIHVSLSPSSQDFLSLSYLGLRKKAYRVAKKCNIFGGSLMFHAFRKDSGGWYFSPHFHLLGYGWVKNVEEVFSKDGWVVKNHGVRESVRGTAFYILTHAGVHEKIKTITWFGCLAYSQRVKVSPLPKSESKCPVCGRMLVPLAYFGKKPLPKEEGFYLWEASKFVEIDYRNQFFKERELGAVSYKEWELWRIKWS
jgi:hypothetical protein